MDELVVLPTAWSAATALPYVAESFRCRAPRRSLRRLMQCVKRLNATAGSA